MAREPQEKWWDKGHAAIAIGVSAMLAIGYLQGLLMERWEFAICGYFTGSVLTYFLLRWLAIRREKKWLALMEQLEKERQDEDELWEAKRQRMIQEIDELRKDIIRLFDSKSSNPPLQ